MATERAASILHREQETDAGARRRGSLLAADYLGVPPSVRAGSGSLGSNPSRPRPRLISVLILSSEGMGGGGPSSAVRCSSYFLLFSVIRVPSCADLIIPDLPLGLPTAYKKNLAEASSVPKFRSPVTSNYFISSPRAARTN